MRQINFLTEDILKELEAKAIKLSLVITASVLTGLFLINFLVLSKGVKGAESQYQIMREEERQALTQGDSYALTELKEKIEGLKRENADFQMFFGLDRFNTFLLKILSNLTANKVWLNKLSIDNFSGTCTMSGSGYSGEALSEFIQNLKVCPLIESVELGNMEKDSEQAGIINFSLAGSLKMKMEKPEETFGEH